MAIRQQVCCYQEETVADGQEELEHLDLVLQLHDEELMVRSLYWYGLSVLVRSLRTGTVSPYWYGLSVLVRSLRTGMVSLYWYGLSVLVWSLCTGMVSLYWYGLSVLVWSLCTGTGLSGLPGITSAKNTHYHYHYTRCARYQVKYGFL